MKSSQRISIPELEEILKLEVPCRPDIHLSERYGTNVSILDGSRYPLTHTVKDVRSASIILSDIAEGLDFIVYYDITWGNSGIAHAKAAGIARNRGLNIETVAMIPEGYPDLREDLERFGAIVCEINPEVYISDKDVDRIVREALAKSGKARDWPEINIREVSERNGDNLAYRRLAQELARQNPYADIVTVPYGGGQVGKQLYYSLLQEYQEGRLNKVPLVILAHTQDRKNIAGRNLTKDKTLTKYVAFEDEINRLAEQGRVVVVEVPEELRNHEFQYLTDNNLARIELTSANAFAGARLYFGQNPPCKNANVVVVNTGKGNLFPSYVMN